MKNISILLFVFVLFSGVGYSQKIEFIEIKDSLSIPQKEYFEFLNDSIDASDAMYLAKIKSSGDLKKISDLFYAIKEAGQKLGGNSFKFVGFEATDGDKGNLILEVYVSSELLLDRNFDTSSKKKVFIFGDDNYNGKKKQTYKINGEKKEIGSAEYSEFDVPIQQELKINKGGFTGMTLWISGKEHKGSSFFSFSGIGVSGAGFSPNMGAGIMINTGKIDRFDPNLGFVLMKIFRKR